MENKKMLAVMMISFVSSLALSQNGTQNLTNAQIKKPILTKQVVTKPTFEIQNSPAPIEIKKPVEGPLGKFLKLDVKLGPGSGGGGDPYTLDFLSTIEKEVIPWLERNGHTLETPVSADTFKTYVNPQRVAVLPDVYESCNGTTEGRNVVGCYNAQEKIWLISRNFYPLDIVDSPMKRNFIMHEIFRAMGIEGDDYRLTKSVSQFQVVSEEMMSCVVNMRQSKSSDGGNMQSQQSIDYCRRTGASIEAQICLITLRQYKSTKYKDVYGAEFDGEAAMKSCLRSGADPKFYNCVSNMRRSTSSGGAGLSQDGAIRACERSGSDEKYQRCIIRYRMSPSSGGAGMDENDAIDGCRAR